ncbi:MAG: DUF2845 domain-containing protein [Smithella sp.]|jgi:hypothetical protein
MWKLFFLLISFVFLLPFDTLASSFRCSSEIIESGDSSYKVQDKCGQPVSKQIVGYTINENSKRELVIEEWVYNRENIRVVITMIGNKVNHIKEESRW